MRISENKKLYYQQIGKWPDIPLFFQPWYLDIVRQNGTWDAAISLNKAGKIQGVLPYFLSSKYGISHITMPVLTPYLGPWLIYQHKILKKTSLYRHQKKVLQELSDQLPSPLLTKMHFHPKVTNVLPFLWRGYDGVVRYTYILSKKNEDELWVNLDAKQRNIIKQNSEKFTIIVSSDIEQFYALNKMSFDRAGKKIPYSMSFLSKLDKALVEHSIGSCQHRTIFLAKDEKNQIHAGAYIVYDVHSSYCLALGNNPKYKNSGALPLLVWHSILNSLERTEVYNFEGGMIPNIEQFFRSFGGELTPYYCLQKPKNRIVKIFLQLINKI